MLSTNIHWNATVKDKNDGVKDKDDGNEENKRQPHNPVIRLVPPNHRPNADKLRGFILLNGTYTEPDCSRTSAHITPPL